MVDEEIFETALKAFVGEQVLAAVGPIALSGIAEIKFGAVRSEDGETLEPSMMIVLHVKRFMAMFGEMAKTVGAADEPDAAMADLLRAALRPRPAKDC